MHLEYQSSWQQKLSVVKSAAKANIAKVLSFREGVCTFFSLHFNPRQMTDRIPETRQLSINIDNDKAFFLSEGSALCFSYQKSIEKSSTDVFLLFVLIE